MQICTITTASANQITTLLDQVLRIFKGTTCSLGWCNNHLSVGQQFINQGFNLLGKYCFTLTFDYLRKLVHVFLCTHMLWGCKQSQSFCNAQFLLGRSHRARWSVGISFSCSMLFLLDAFSFKCVHQIIFSSKDVAKNEYPQATWVCCEPQFQ